MPKQLQAGCKSLVRTGIGRLTVAAVLALALGCVASAEDDQPATSPNAFILIKDTTGPFVTRRLAERLAVAVIEEKYSKDSFVVRGTPQVLDQDSTWAVTVENAVPLPAKSLVPKRLTILIRKANAEIVGMS